MNRKGLNAGVQQRITTLQADLAPRLPILNHCTRSMITQILQLDQNILETGTRTSCALLSSTKTITPGFFKTMGKYFIPLKANDDQPRQT